MAKQTHPHPDAARYVDTIKGAYPALQHVTHTITISVGQLAEEWASGSSRYPSPADYRKHVGVLAQLFSILCSSEKIDVKRSAVAKLIISPLQFDRSACDLVDGFENASLSQLAKYKGKLTYRYLLKNIPLNSMVALAATESSPVTVQGILLSNAHNGTWTQFDADYGFDHNEFAAFLNTNLVSLINMLDPNAGILDACAWFPQGPFANGFNVAQAAAASTGTPVATAAVNDDGVTTATTTTATATSTQGTNMTTASTFNAASLNPAVKPLIDGMLAQVGVNLTIDSIVQQLNEKDQLKAAMVHKDKAHEDIVTELRRKLQSAASAPTTMSIAPVNSTIPGGSMNMVSADTLFPQLSGLTLNVPHFTWDHAHPDVPAINHDYIFRKELLIKVLRCLVTGENIWLQGHTGSGKTTLVEQVAARLGWPVARVAFDSNVDRSELVGRMQLDGDGKGGTVSRWLPGILEKATANGYILLCDELDAGHPNALYTLQPILEGKPLTLLEDGGRVVTRGVMSRNMATGNTTGNGDPSGLYPACRILSAATLDRFTNFVNVPYMTTEEETKLIDSQVPGLAKSLVSKLVKFGTEMRHAFVTNQTPISYSPRRSVAFAREIDDLKGMGFKDETTVITAAFKSKLYDAASEEFRQRITEIANASFGGIDPTKNLS